MESHARIPSSHPELWRCLDAHEDGPYCSAALQSYLLESPDALDENGRTPACRAAFQSKKLLARMICRIIPGSGRPDLYGLTASDYLEMVYPSRELEKRQHAAHVLELRVQGERGIDLARKSQDEHVGLKREDPP